jgi:predicted lipid-binding transport protein (Tim44 family)
MSGGTAELILFGMVAAFLVLRLRSVLGKRTGYERPAQPVAAPGARPAETRPGGAPQAAQPGQPHLVVPDARTPPGQALSRIGAEDPAFDAYRFLAGAEGAFRMIVGAFAAGDRTTLKPLLSDDSYAGFEHAITAREQAHETQRTEVRGVTELAIDAADLRGSTADVTVKFVTEQVNITMAADGSVAHGHDGVTELTDLWTFQRDLRSPDPTWRLVATRSV